MTNDTRYLPAEWEPQQAVQLTWPHADTDWAPLLKVVEVCYIRMAREIAKREKLLVVTPHREQVRQLLAAQLPADSLARVTVAEMPTDDTWARDHGFITLVDHEGQATLLDFRFNGWGQKFASSQDNQICRRMAAMHLIDGRYEGHLDFVLEGGSIESDGQGTLLTTTQCLTAPNRNEPLSKAEIEQRLLTALHARRVLWLDHGFLAGDDTDSHIDTLARLCPDNTIAYVQCTDPDDEHYEALKAMELQLQSFRTADGKPYRLVALPMAAEEFDEEGQRLPATYANFLIVNGAVLMPTYGRAALDQQAARQLQTAFPDREIVPIDCRVLIEQHGSLHCCTIQFPCKPIE
ncbi:MAG: agmatine deiminase family protein [Bacteroidaceae bacterium]|nr:agmatine deiminase family protein [Bacteroidaceae bacterium]